MKYSKLVRDKIPDVIRKRGESAVTHIADEKEYWQKITEKLQEEVDEFIANPSEEELVDINEVINAICEFRKINRQRLEYLRKKKAEEKGSFKNRVILDEAG